MIATIFYSSSSINSILAAALLNNKLNNENQIVTIIDVNPKTSLSIKDFSTNNYWFGVQPDQILIDNFKLDHEGLDFLGHNIGFLTELKVNNFFNEVYTIKEMLESENINTYTLPSISGLLLEYNILIDIDSEINNLIRLTYEYENGNKNINIEEQTLVFMNVQKAKESLVKNIYFINYKSDIFNEGDIIKDYLLDNYNYFIKGIKIIISRTIEKRTIYLSNQEVLLIPFLNVNLEFWSFVKRIISLSKENYVLFERQNGTVVYEIVSKSNLVKKEITEKFLNDNALPIDILT